MINFNTNNSTLRQLLGNGLTYHVPPFQRDYSWSEDEWDDLWLDLIALFAENGEIAHYLGYLVLQSTDQKHFEIIDGQQRLTTLSIMILAGLDYLEDLVKADLDGEKNRRRKEQLQNSYIGYVDLVSLIPRSKLELNRHNNNFYQTYLVPLQTMPKRGLNSSEKLLRKAFEWFKFCFENRFKTEVKSGENLASFIDTLVDKLFFTVITVTDELNAFKVFETLNARGVRLSATDLLKNYLFSLISTEKSHETELKALEDQWERIVGLLGSESFPEFLRVFWNTSHKLVRKSDLFKTIRSEITTRQEAFKLVRQLDQGADLYGALGDPQDERWEKAEKEALQELQLFSVRQPLAMLMSCYQKFFTSERQTFTKILENIAIISFRYHVICNLPTYEQERLYNQIANQIFEGIYNSYEDILKALKELDPEDQLFKNAFAQKELNTKNNHNKKIVRYILFEIEKQRSGKAFDLESGTYNIEHILPENPSEDWSYISENKQEQLIYRLGNMTPLETTANRKLGNANYTKKKIIYAQSNFQITQTISTHYDTWNEQKIDSRQTQLAKIACGIWRIDLGS